jgi:hypothetical protein
MRLATGGITQEPAAVWTLKDEIQKRMVRAGRRMPYELPALYAAQRGVSDKLFGEGDENKKVKWYNPVDVVSDFVKTSTVNMLTMVAPFEVGGAGLAASKNSLSSFKNSMDSLKSLSPGKQKMVKGYVDLTELLSEVGHDFSTITNRVLRTTAQTSAGFNAAAEALNEQPRIVQALRDSRAGAEEARRRSVAAGASELRTAGSMARALAFGSEDKYGALDAIPAFRGLSRAVQVGFQEFKLFGKGYDALESSFKYDRIIAEARGATGRYSVDNIHRAMDTIQQQYSSRISRLAGQVAVLGGGGPGDKSFNRSDFYYGQQESEYKKLISRKLQERGLTESESESFARNLRVRPPVGKGTDVTNIVSIGRNKVTAEGDEYYKQIIERYKGIKGGKDFADNLTTAAGGSSPEEFLRGILNDVNANYSSREFQTLLKNKVTKQWNQFYRNDLADVASTFLKPQKANFNDFVGPLGDKQQQFLQRKTAQSLGIKLKETNGRLISDDEVRNKLAQRGYNPNNFASLRSFLIENKQMTSGIFNGGFNLFGMKPMLIDEAIESGRFDRLSTNERKVITDLAGSMARHDPVSKSIGFNTLDGVYKTRSGNVLDFSAIKNVAGKTADFFASEFHIPIIKLNPADLFGYRSFAGMSRRGPLQYSPGMTVQPFHGFKGDRSDFHIWHSTGGFLGTKGKVTAYSSDDFSGEVFGRTLKGTYRPAPTNSTEMYTRHARIAANLEGDTTYDIAGKSGSRFLDFILGNSDRARTFKRVMNVDAEQPNSIFGLISRFTQRNKDVNNPKILSRLVSGEEVEFTSAGTRKTMRLDTSGGSLRVIDDTGAAVAGVDEAALLRSYEAVRKQSFDSGFSKQFMEALEESNPDLFTTIAGARVSEMDTPRHLLNFLDQLESALPGIANRLRTSGTYDPAIIQKSYSRIRALRRQADLLSASQLSGKTPSITTTFDELRSETFRFISQTNAFMRGDTDTIFIEMQNALRTMKSSLPASQYAEAQAAALSTLFNMHAFKTFKQGEELLTNARNAAVSMFNHGRSNPDVVKGLFEPFTKGTFGLMSTNVRRPFTTLLPGAKRTFGTAPYMIDDLSVDPLGSGQGITFVPTFGTVFDASPMAAIKSALGINTYQNPEGFSGASIPISQGVERLNKNFGTFGMQLDVSGFKGPLDLYARGMVGKRVLPLYGAGAAAMTVDRTIGGMVNGRDESGERVYSPFFTTKAARGIVEAQSLLAGITPGGMNTEEKREQLLEGEVPIRQGRFWPLGNTPFEGGKIMYYRPSWYRKLQAGAMFTSDSFGSPAEKFLFYNDISPLRPLDPYRFERKHYSDRPYPVSGDYFTGPWGPLTAALNATVGKVLKPQVFMHEQEVMQGLGAYVPAGASGAYNASGYSQPQVTNDLIRSGFGMGGGVPGYGAAVSNDGAGMGGGQPMISGSNALYAGAGNYPSSTAQRITMSNIAGLNAPLNQLSYGPPKQRGVMQPGIVPTGEPLSSVGMGSQFREFGYRSQEMLGIYGFSMATVREKFGFGQGDFEPSRSVLQAASKAYGTGRAFWDLNLGGLGDVPLTAQGPLGNLEVSEIVRRFIPKERTGIDYLNPIQNTMGQQYPFLPGSEYFTNFKTGDPFTKVQEGELRLPGIGYERLNTLYSDSTGRYGILNQLDILGDVAPYSEQFKKINRLADSMITDAGQKQKLAEIREQVANTTKRYDFSDYKYRDSSAEEQGLHPYVFKAKQFGEYLAHRDTIFNTKLMQKRTAVEDWERRNVYGSTFPQWQRPFESFIQPMIDKSTQRNPIAAAAGLGVAGSLFGRTARGKLFGSLLGTATGFTASSIGNISQAVSDERYIPLHRKKELALEEYTDILNYVKNTRLAGMAQESGDSASANQFRQAAKRTMYGADIYGASMDTLSLAIPKRKREHFKEMINAPEQDRKRILSTAGRLERRIYEAAWGMQVEQRPDLEEYFSRHELPDASWEGWHPNTNMEHVKIKIGNSMGVDMSQMGYYPQQIKEANLTGPSYPEFNKKEDNNSSLISRLRNVLSGSGISGVITPVMNPFGSNSIDISAGIR